MTAICLIMSTMNVSNVMNLVCLLLCSFTVFISFRYFQAELLKQELEGVCVSSLYMA